MKRMFCVLGALIAFSGTSASAQLAINLSGQFVCVQGCMSGAPGAFAFVTQNGWDVNLTNEAGASSRAWIDWPGHIWVDAWAEGAIYSPDGNSIRSRRSVAALRSAAAPAASAGAAPLPRSQVTRTGKRRVLGNWTRRPRRPKLKRLRRGDR
jgi:hypothetical protein